MSVYFLQELDRIKNRLIELGTATEDAVHRAVQSVIMRDASISANLAEFDRSIDESEVRIEEEILKILALHQPVAIDLRFLVAVLKITNDLERIGDLALNISKRAKILDANPHIQVPVDFSQMTGQAEMMLRDCINALIHLSEESAVRVCKQDDGVDACKKQHDETIKKHLVAATDQANIDVLVAVLAVARDLERIADHTTNIAEDVIYLTGGQIIRHHAEEYDAKREQAGQSSPKKM